MSGRIILKIAVALILAGGAGILLSSSPVLSGDRGLMNGSFKLAMSKCYRGMTYCAPGSYGPGGCYKSGYASCTAGRVCGSGMRACAPGRYGNGGCYKPVYANCTAGLVCGGGTRACIKGGKARCYNPSYGRC